MEHRDVFVLEEIIGYCDKIVEYLDEFKIDFEEFIKVPRHQDLCAFYCIQIGENAHNLSAKFIESHSDMAWHRITGLRNYIAHEYGNIKPEILWDTVNTDIPALRSYCSAIIE